MPKERQFNVHLMGFGALGVQSLCKQFAALLQNREGSVSSNNTIWSKVSNAPHLQIEKVASLSDNLKAACGQQNLYCWGLWG